MKPKITRIICFVALLFGLGRVVPAQTRGPCSVASLAGEWGYTETGFVVMPTGTVPAAAVGKYSFDAAGTFSGAQYSSAGGNVSHDTKKGTFTVNPDCTGTLQLSVYDQSGNLVRNSVWSIVYVDSAKELRGIMISLALPNGTNLAPVMTLSGKKMVPGRGND